MKKNIWSILMMCGLSGVIVGLTGLNLQNRLMRIKASDSIKIKLMGGE